MELFLMIVILILVGDSIFKRLDLKSLEERLESHKEIMDIQDRRIDKLWQDINNL